MLGPLWRIFRRGRKPQDSVAARWRRSYVLASLAAAIAGVALSIAAGTGVWLHENQLAEVELGDRADNHAMLLQYGIKEDLKALSGLRARFQTADGEIGRRKFASFSGLLLRDQPAIQSLAWAPRVTRAERDAFEVAATRDGIPGFQIKAVTASGLARSEEREEYFPILYSATGAASSSVYGLDLNSEPMRRDTLERARDGGKPAASSVFRLPQRSEIGEPSSSSCRCSRQDRSTNSVESRRRNLAGFVLGLFRIEAMVEMILARAAAPAGLDLYLFGTAESGL